MEKFKTILKENEDWLMGRILKYAQERGYIRYTSTLKEAWRLSISGLSDSLLSMIDRDPSTTIELSPDDNFSQDPAASFGIREAKAHRRRGINLDMFLGLMKYYRQSYLDMIQANEFEPGEKEPCLKIVERFFDRVEIGFCAEWTSLSDDKKLCELQETNRGMTNEKNRYLTIFESLPNPVIFTDSENRVENMNQAASKLFSGPGIPGSQYYRIPAEGDSDNSREQSRKALAELLPWMSHEFQNFLESDVSDQRFEKIVETLKGELSFNVKLSRMLDISGKFSGSIIIFENITDRKDMEQELRQTTLNLRRNVRELEKANRQIIQQQTAIIEEERLKVLLQMAGATAHEMNQPLMALLGSIQLMGMDRENPEKVTRYMAQIEEAGQRIAEIVKKIQTIRHDEIKPYAGNSTILNLDQDVNILSIEDNDDDFDNIRTILQYDEQINLLRARDINEALQVLEQQSVDMIFLDYILPSGTGIDFLMQLGEMKIDVPTIIITGQGDEIVASRLLQAGAYDYLPKISISAKSLSRVIANSMEKYRLKKEVKMVMNRMAEMMTKDELTGFYNRRYFIEVIEREVAGAERYKHQLVMCMLELDNFKQINDAYGHQTGQEVLKQVATLIYDNVRKSDIPCRYDGEKFAVIMPNTNLQDAEVFCERLRTSAENNQLTADANKVNATISIGLSHFAPPSDTTSSDLIKKAQHALYLSQNMGGNRVVSDN